MRGAESLRSARAAFAEQIRALTGLRSERLFEALAEVPREDFVGPGPWQILRPPFAGYEWTPDGDPRHLSDNVLVALVAGRGLNNGEPATLLRWLDALALAPGERMLHVGCGTGYYTAIAAAALSGGSVVAIEIDPALADRATSCLARTANVTVAVGDGCALASGARFDAILVNAGATTPLPAWLDALALGGRLLLPLTVSLPQPGLGAGHVLLVTRCAAGFSARFTWPVGVFDCVGARSGDENHRLAAAYQRGGQERVRSVRLDAHAAGPECWLHADRVCLSEQPPGAV